MAEPVRIRIMNVIASRGEVCAKDILPEFSVTQPTLSHHMRVLVENDLVTARKDGHNVYYSVNRETVRELADLLIQLGEGKGLTNKRTQTRRKQAKAPALKKSSSVPVPKVPSAAPDIEKLKKKKKKKSKDKKKDKKKKK